MGLFNTKQETPKDDNSSKNFQEKNKINRTNTEADISSSNSSSRNNNNIKENKNEIKNDSLNRTMIQSDFDKLMINKSEPNNCILFNEINIFNAILIILSNIDPIKQYMTKETFKQKLEECNKTSKINLSSIFYSLYKYLWNYEDKKSIKEKDLLYKYNEYLKLNINGESPKVFCNNTINLKIILNFIYSTINNELTKEKFKLLEKDKDKKKYKQYNNNMEQSKLLGFYFINNFTQNNNSIISDYLMGFSLEKTICHNCKLIYERNNNNNGNNDDSFYTFYSYENFPYLEFNINEINGNITNNDIMSGSINAMNIFEKPHHYIDIYNCFDYLMNIGHKEYTSICQRCKFNCKQEKNRNILLFPKILTLVLTITDNYNCFFLDELDLKQYTINQMGYEEYKLVAILCQLIYNKKFICYCINTDDGNWYSYSDNKIKFVKKMDNNAIPLILIYQSDETIKYKYNSIERNSFEKCCLNIKFMQGIPFKYIFSKEKSIAYVKQKIKKHSNIQFDDIKLLYNGEKLKDDDKLSDIIKESKDIAEFTAIIVNQEK